MDTFLKYAAYQYQIMKKQKIQKDQLLVRRLNQQSKYSPGLMALHVKIVPNFF